MGEGYCRMEAMIMNNIFLPPLPTRVLLPTVKCPVGCCHV